MNLFIRYLADLCPTLIQNNQDQSSQDQSSYDQSSYDQSIKIRKYQCYSLRDITSE